jgi:hypothetical protein
MTLHALQNKTATVLQSALEGIPVSSADLQRLVVVAGGTVSYRSVSRSSGRNRRNPNDSYRVRVKMNCPDGWAGFETIDIQGRFSPEREAAVWSVRLMKRIWGPLWPMAAIEFQAGDEVDAILKAISKPPRPPKPKAEPVVKRERDRGPKTVVPLTPEQQALVESVLPMCRKEVKRHRAEVLRMSEDDIEQEIRMIAVEAARVWSPEYRNSQGVPTKFSTFCQSVINTRVNRLYGEVGKYLPSVQLPEFADCRAGSAVNDTGYNSRLTNDGPIRDAIDSRDAISLAMEVLDDLHRSVIAFRFGLSGEGECLDVYQIAKRLGITCDDVYEAE